MNPSFASKTNKMQGVKSIYLVGYNHLGANYICGVLKGHYRIKIVQYCHNATPSCPSTSVFLIDAESLPIRLPNLVHWVRYSVPQSKILVIGNNLSIEDVCELVATGIQGTISHNEVAKYLNPAIQSIMTGRLWLRRDILEHFALYSSSSLALNHRKRSIVTPQETRVIALLRRNYSNKEIATALGITERTVKFHLANIFTKVGARDRASALDVILRSGLYKPGNNLNSDVPANCAHQEKAVVGGMFPPPGSSPKLTYSHPDLRGGSPRGDSGQAAENTGRSDSLSRQALRTRQ